MIVCFVWVMFFMLVVMLMLFLVWVWEVLFLSEFVVEEMILFIKVGKFEEVLVVLGKVYVVYECDWMIEVEFYWLVDEFYCVDFGLM